MRRCRRCALALRAWPALSLGLGKRSGSAMVTDSMRTAGVQCEFPTSDNAWVSRKTQVRSKRQQPGAGGWVAEKVALQFSLRQRLYPALPSRNQNASGGRRVREEELQIAQAGGDVDGGGVPWLRLAYLGLSAGSPDHCVRSTDRGYTVGRTRRPARPAPCPPLPPGRRPG
uniref:Putative secreted protein n=1 Tax=Ixodes ricinus TaxID=34613 RepID=A0A6B0UYY6_IXORI